MPVLEIASLVLLRALGWFWLDSLRARDAATRLHLSEGEVLAAHAVSQMSPQAATDSLLATVPQLLGRRFEQLHQAHRSALSTPDDPARWLQPGAWLHTFCQDMRAVLLAQRFGAAGLFHYGGFMASSVLLGLAFLSLAMLLSTLARDRARASGMAIALWFAFVLVFDLLLLGLLVASSGQLAGMAQDLPAYLLLLNPADVFRILNVFSLDDVRRLYGLASLVPPALGNPWLMGGAMAAWIVVPLALAAWRFRP